MAKVVNSSDYVKTNSLCEQIEGICKHYYNKLYILGVLKVIAGLGLAVFIFYSLITVVLWVEGKVVLAVIGIAGLVLTLSMLFIVSHIKKKIEAMRLSVIKQFLSDSGVSNLYAVGISHKLYSIEIMKDFVEVIDDEKGISFKLCFDAHFSEDLTLDKIFMDKAEALKFLQAVENKQFIEMEKIIGKEAALQLYDSSEISKWFRDYFNLVHNFKHYYKREGIAELKPELYMEEDLVGFLSWLYKNKLTETRTTAEKYSLIIKGFMSYCDYPGGICRLCKIEK